MDAIDDSRAEADAEAGYARTVRITATIGGVVAIVLGIILLAWPHETILVVTALLGISLVVSGLLTLIRALFSAADSGARAMPAFGGLLTLAVGVICLRNLSNTAALLAAIFGVAWLITGIAEIFGAFGHRQQGSIRMTMLLFGAVSIIGGLVVLVWPAISLVTLTVLIGLWLLVGGLTQLWIAWRMRSLEMTATVRSSATA